MNTMFTFGLQLYETGLKSQQNKPSNNQIRLIFSILWANHGPTGIPVYPDFQLSPGHFPASPNQEKIISQYPLKMDVWGIFVTLFQTHTSVGPKYLTLKLNFPC
jgi:hypothetical protein